MWPIIIIAWVSCGILGAVVGSGKQSTAEGGFLGLIFGPLGVIAAFALDNRPKCPACGGRLNGEVRKCQHCGEPVPKKSQTVSFYSSARTENLDAFQKAQQEWSQRNRQEREREAEARAEKHKRGEERRKRRAEWWEYKGEEGRFLIKFWVIVGVSTVVVFGVTYLIVIR